MSQTSALFSFEGIGIQRVLQVTSHCQRYAGRVEGVTSLARRTPVCLDLF